MIYCKVENGRVTQRAVFDAQMPPDWEDFASWVQNDIAQIGWAYIAGEFKKPEPEVKHPTGFRLVPRATMVERLNTAGKIVQLTAFLASHPYQRERWYANLSFKSDDAVIVAMLNSIRVDPAVIMAP